MNQEKIGAFIALLRREKGYTQREIADRLELSEKTISSLLRRLHFLTLS